MNFSVGEKVLCYHGPLIYQAKVLEAEIWTGVDPSEGGFTGPHYFVHYQGWKQSWDEWVPETRMLKFNDENVQRQKALVAAAQQKKKDAKEAASASSAAASSSKGSGSTSSANARSRPRDSDEKRRSTADASGRGSAKRSRTDASSVSAGAGGRGGSPGDDDENVRRPEIKLIIPDSLKVQLVDDWENVTKKNLLVALPKKPNVQEILRMYRAYVVDRRKEAKSASASGTGSPAPSVNNAPLPVVDEVLQGLELYFDKSLGNNLLYRYERQQYLQVRKAGGNGGSGGGGTAAATSGDSGVAAALKNGATRKGKREVSAADVVDVDEKPPSEVYGAEHLLRLFVNLPSIVAHTTMDSESVSILREHLDDFLGFMVKEKVKLFGRYTTAAAASLGTGSYQESSPVYGRLSGI